MSKQEQTSTQPSFLTSAGEVISQIIPSMDVVRTKLTGRPLTEPIYERMKPLLKNGLSPEAAYQQIAAEDNTRPWEDLGYQQTKLKRRR